MKIEKFKKFRNGTYKIILDNKEQIIVNEEIIINNGLLFHKEIDSLLLDKINIENNYYNIYNKVVKMITRKLRSEKEIKKFLEKEHVSNDDNKKMISNLKNNNLINDLVFAKAYYSDHINLTSDGPEKIFKELSDHDIEINIINDLKNSVDNEFIKDKLNKIIIKKVNSNHNHSEYMIKQKIIGDLLLLGYEKGMILDCLNNIQFDCSCALKKEYEKVYLRLSKKYKDSELDMQVKYKLIGKGFKKEEIDKLIN